MHGLRTTLPIGVTTSDTGWLANHLGLRPRLTRELEGELWLGYAHMTHGGLIKLVPKAPEHAHVVDVETRGPIAGRQLDAVGQ